MKLLKKKIVIVAFLLISLLLSPLFTVKAQTAPTVNDFKFSYQTLKNRLQSNARIQLFGDGAVIAEFDDNTNVYAGHLGSFWAPPYFSSNRNRGEAYIVNSYPLLYGDPNNLWKEAFNMGMVIYNYTAGGGVSELPSSSSTEAFWYPSKMVLTKFYPGSGGGTDVKGVKFTLPDSRGFGLKYSLTNLSSTPQQYGLLFLASLPTLETRRTWPNNPPTSFITGWNWELGPSLTHSTLGSYDASENMIIISDTFNSAYMAIGLSQTIYAYEISDTNAPMYDYYKTQNTGTLRNLQNDNSTIPGTALGLAVKFAPLSQGNSASATIIFGLGATEAEAKAIVRTYRTSDVETIVDSDWNTKLNNLFSNIPIVETNDAVINQIYKNSALGYLFNKREKLDMVTEIAGFSQSTALFPWLMGDTSFFPLADPVFWKGQLKKLMTLNYANCRAYNPLSTTTINLHLCDVRYSGSIPSLVDSVYNYIVYTADYGFLNELVNGKTVFTLVNELLTTEDAKIDPADNLANFGNDRNLYEFDIWCSLGGKYTGKVVSPNAELMIAHRQMAELAVLMGNSTLVNQHTQTAGKLKTGIQSLWNGSWFDTISMYDPNGLAKTPQRITFYTIFPYFLLQYDDLLTTVQQQTLVNYLPNFKQSYGLTSLRVGDIWCSREDWHGPGLYSGAVGAVLSGLFKTGYSTQAYDLLSPVDGTGYAYLKDMPYFSQAFPSGSNTGGSLATAYLEGISVAQSIIEGMFGISPDTEKVKIAPNIPSRLLTKGSVSLTNLRAQDYKFTISLASMSNQNITINPPVNINQPNPVADNFIFGYTMAGTLNVTVTNLRPSSGYVITTTATATNNSTKKQVYANSSGNAVFQLSLNGDYTVSGVYGILPTSTPIPTPTNTPTSTVTPLPTLTPTPALCEPLGDLDCNEKVNILDLSTLLSNFGSTTYMTGDLNKNGKVDIFDLSILLSNFGR